VFEEGGDRRDRHVGWSRCGARRQSASSTLLTVVSPTEVRDVLLDHPFVAAAEVVNRPNPRSGQAGPRLRGARRRRPPGLRALAVAGTDLVATVSTGQLHAALAHAGGDMRYPRR
jgi:hypothetical protein